MKRLWAAGLLFLFAAALCLWQSWNTGRTTDLLEQEVRAIVEASNQENASLAQTHALAAVQEWENARGPLCIYTAHTRVEELGHTLSTLPPLARYAAFDQLSAECERALAQIDSLRWIDRPTPENILSFHPHKIN